MADHYSIEMAIERLNELGVNISDIYQDYNKIPIENMDLNLIENKVPKRKKIVSKHNVVIDSRQRDYSIYPYPSNYLVQLFESYRNVERIELIAAVMPKTEYNINTENNLLNVTINGISQYLILNQGQYTIGSNNPGNVNYSSNETPVIFGILAELQQTLNKHTESLNAFNVFLATVPPEIGTGNNASVLNRIVITNSLVNFTINFINEYNNSGSPYRILGFFKKEYNSELNNKIYGSSDLGMCSQTDLINQTIHQIGINSMIGSFDYDLKDDPKYIIMQLEFGNKTAERIESIDIATNQKFAVVIYDANEPDNIQTYNCSKNNDDPVQITISRQPGRLKALKGTDFDKKIVIFDPPITLENFKISFYKYDNTPYQFNNREHMLTFEIDVADYNPEYRY